MQGQHLLYKRPVMPCMRGMYAASSAYTVVQQPPLVLELLGTTGAAVATMPPAAV